MTLYELRDREEAIRRLRILLPKWAWTFLDIAMADGELAESDAAAMRWYRAASPYATPEALREALEKIDNGPRRA